MIEPKFNMEVCKLCLKTIGRGVQLIRGGKVNEGLNHLDQLMMHVEEWQKRLEFDEDEAGKDSDPSQSD